MTAKISSASKEITIVGGGIIGCSSAYFLTRHPSYDRTLHRITLLEAASSSDRGGRTADSIYDPATLAGDGGARRNPAHDGIAGGASGKAGGLLALWAFPSNIVPLSWRLHAELAAEHDGARRWGYRRCFARQVQCRARLPGGSRPPQAGGGDTSGTGTGTETGATTGLHADQQRDLHALQRPYGGPPDLDWLDGGQPMVGYESMGTPVDTAQVHPELFTRSMAQLASEQGVRIVTGARVTAINKRPQEGQQQQNQQQLVVDSVTYETEDGSQHNLQTTDCVVAAGPWTARLLPNVPVTASRAHSVVIRTPRPVSAYAVFTSITLPVGFSTPTPFWARGQAGAREPLPTVGFVEPEIYARPDGTAYVCGPTDNTVPLPLTTAEVEVDVGRCQDVIDQVGSISDELGKDGEVLAKQACYLPQGGPFIGQVPGTKGLIVAAGHTCWGIQNAPATGKLVSEIILDGEAKSANLGSCSLVGLV